MNITELKGLIQARQEPAVNLTVQTRVVLTLSSSSVLKVGAGYDRMQGRMTAGKFCCMDMALCDRIWPEGWEIASFSGRSAAKEEPQICMSRHFHGYSLAKLLNYREMLHELAGCY
jgi:hypothetical protein